MLRWFYDPFLDDAGECNERGKTSVPASCSSFDRCVFNELDHVVVRMAPAPQGDEAWSDKVLAAHAAHRRQIRRTFERLRPRRGRFRRQTDGPDLDLEALAADPGAVAALRDFTESA